MLTATEEIEALVTVLPHCKPHVTNLENMLKGKPYAEGLTLYLLKEFISKNEPCAKKIVGAVDYLKSKNDAVPAIKKAARAIYDNKITIFF